MGTANGRTYLWYHCDYGNPSDPYALRMMVGKIADLRATQPGYEAPPPNYLTANEGAEVGLAAWRCTDRSDIYYLQIDSEPGVVVAETQQQRDLRTICDRL